MHCISWCLCCVGSQTACNFGTGLELINNRDLGYECLEIERAVQTCLDPTSFNSPTIILKAGQPVSNPDNLSQKHTTCLLTIQNVTNSTS